MTKDERRMTINYFAAASISLLILFSCANPGTKSLTGGPKDETPPLVVNSIPENYSTNFAAIEVEITFDEYLKPLQGLNQKLVISPVMDEMPEIKLKGKSIIIKFKSELLPDRTYALNFGDAVADLNEGNVFENFMYVFSTGDKLDSLEMSGIVRSAFDNKPLEGAAVMLYQDDQDSLPLTDLPIYLSLTDKEGKFSLRNLAGGSYKVFTLKDANSNFLFDQLKEEIGFLDTLITPGVRIIEKALAADTLQLPDSLAPADSLQLSDSVLLADSMLLADSLPMNDSIPPTELIALTDSIPLTDSIQAADSLPVADSLKVKASKPKYEYYPKNIELYTFTEIIKRQFISSTARPIANKIEVIFHQPLDSLTLNLFPITNPNPSPKSSPYVLSPNSYFLSYSPTKDSLDIWLIDTTYANCDTIVFNFQYTGFDSLEQPIPFSDTVTFSFRKPIPKKGEKKSNPFKIKTNFDRTKELGQAANITFSEPWEKMDTSKIELARTQDTLKFPQEFKLKPDTLVMFDVRWEPTQMKEEGNRKKEIEQKTNDERRMTNDEKVTNDYKLETKDSPFPSPLSYFLSTVFLPDSTYSLTLLPGAFITHAGLTNDTTKIRFKVNTEDKYGSIILEMEEVHQPVILQLIKGKDKVVVERQLDQSGPVIFAMLKPGKYSFKLILDKNNNGRWDPGRYLLGIQPERVLYYGKELDLKANWEMEETWTLEKE